MLICSPSTIPSNVQTILLRTLEMVIALEMVFIFRTMREYFASLASTKSRKGIQHEIIKW